MLKSSEDVGMSEMLVGHLRVRKSEFRSVAVLSSWPEQWAEAVKGNMVLTQSSFSMGRGSGGREQPSRSMLSTPFLRDPL